LKEDGNDVYFEQNVRFIIGDAQLNAPCEIMQQFKRAEGTYRIVESSPLLERGIDCEVREDIDGGYLFKARGIIKISYLEMLEDNPKGARIMDEYYKLLSTRKYGKNANDIRQEVRLMSKDDAIQWIESTYDKYVRDAIEFINVLSTPVL
jgi:hypothetical protein